MKLFLWFSWKFPEVFISSKFAWDFVLIFSKILLSLQYFPKFSISSNFLKIFPHFFLLNIVFLKFHQRFTYFPKIFLLRFSKYQFSTSNIERDRIWRSTDRAHLETKWCVFPFTFIAALHKQPCCNLQH